MKQLQNNYTTQEQSRRLLELGVPADSADCYYNSGRYANTPTVIGDKTGRQYEMICGKLIPCWSVGRLMEIYVIARGLDTAYLPIERGEDMVKYLIRLYEEKARDFDFSKLEE